MTLQTFDSYLREDVRIPRPIRYRLHPLCKTREGDTYRLEAWPELVEMYRRRCPPCTRMRVSLPHRRQKNPTCGDCTCTVAARLSSGSSRTGPNSQWISCVTGGGHCMMYGTYDNATYSRADPSSGGKTTGKTSARYGEAPHIRVCIRGGECRNLSSPSLSDLS